MREFLVELWQAFIWYAKGEHIRVQHEAWMAVLDSLQKQYKQ